MLDHLFDRMVRALIRSGCLDITYPDGRTRRYGDGAGPLVHVHIDDAGLIPRMLRSPAMGLGEGYTEGGLWIEADDLHGLLDIVLRNQADDLRFWWLTPQRILRQAGRVYRQYNPLHKARTNVAHHYDLSQDLYDRFLDADLQYSCAYFRDPGDSLDVAQANKKHHIAGKLLLEPGMRVLDIGCGWGGMALTLARDYGAEVVGLTLSRDQHRIATERAEAEGLSDRVSFRMQDYREVEETFDRIVSVGMFEHVGVPHYREYFAGVRARLARSGVALIHTIGRLKPPAGTSPWIDKYIFPGGYVPALSEVMAAVEREALWACDVEVWRLHYAETLRAWQERFRARIPELPDLDTPEFRRMWWFYLVASEMSFRQGRHCVFQLQLSREQEAVPLTRDYLYRPDVERGQRQAAE